MSQLKTKKLIMLGAGGHAAVLMDILALQNIEITAFVSPEVKNSRSCFKAKEQFFSDDDVLKYTPDEVLLINGIGFTPDNNLRAKLYGFFSEKGYQFKSIISHHAIISANAKLKSGVQILHRAVVQSGAVINENTLINTAAIIEHDCFIGADNHIAPSATLCGGVTTNEQVFIGSGATIIPNIEIGKHAMIAAGAVITKDIAENQRVYPAR